MTPDKRPARPQADETAILWTGAVHAPDGLNLRQTPDTTLAPLALLDHATALQVLEEHGDWLRVRAGEQTGYVFAAHVLRRVHPQPVDGGGMRGREDEDAWAAPRDQRIELDGTAGSTERLLAGVWNRYGAALLAEAQRLQLDPGLAAALLAVESNGTGFAHDGRLIIRFENHLFYHYWGQHHQAQYFAHFAFDSSASWRGHRWRPDPSLPWGECHLDDQAVEWQVFSFARQLDAGAALLSISMGMAQIMGFNYAAAGFDSAESMFAACSQSIAHQIGGFFRFLENNRLVEPARAGDYHAFARGYNGPGQADFYAAKVQMYVATLAAPRRPAPAAAPAAAPAGAWPALPPAYSAEDEAQGRRWWLGIAAAALGVLALLVLALHRAGWRLVRRPDPLPDPRGAGKE